MPSDHVVLVELTDGVPTSVSSTHSTQVMFLDRSNIDPSSTDYREDALGAPAQISCFDTDKDITVANQYKQILNSGEDCSCDEEAA